MTTTHQARERFQVNTLGMRQLHADRHPEELVKELIQNAFDEEVNSCTVEVDRQEQGVLVVVTDDGPGFADIQDAYTLMAETSKRLDPDKRGRFNLGDKEVISVALWARVETVGWTVDFPQEGGRTVSENQRTLGTAITAMMPWGQEEADRLSERLALIRPPENVAYTVNGTPIPRQQELAVREATLPTVLQSGPGQPLRPTRRKTRIHVLEPRGPRGWIHEMGIPIQALDLPFDVDVTQKVPMPPNRDTVSESYLKDIYAEVLNAMHDHMEAQDFSGNWVRTAVESPRMQEETVQTTLKERYGEKVVTWSSDTHANMEATDQGFEVIHPRTMSRPERHNLRELGGLRSSHELFGRPDPIAQVIDVTGDTVKEEFAAWVIQLGRMVGREVTPVFIRDTHSQAMASCTMNTETPTMNINVHYLQDDFLAGRGQDQLDLIIHELAHSYLQGKVSHGPQWGASCATVGAAIAHALMAGSHQDPTPASRSKAPPAPEARQQPTG